MTFDKHIFSNLLRPLLLASALLAGSASWASAQEVTLKMHQFLPANANAPKLVLDVWAEQVEKESGGRIKIDHYPSMQLGGRPPEVRKQKPRVAAFTSADIPKILALEPDMVLSFSDLQAPIVAELIKLGVTVMAYNQRDIAGILAMIRHLGAMVGAGDRSEKLAQSYEQKLAEIAERAARPAAPLVYFEEWDTPMISGIKWVSELIEIAGGRDVFAELAEQKSASDRIVTSNQA